MADINLVQFYNAIQQGAREATLQVLESALADPATSAKQDTIKGVLDTLATETTLTALKDLLDNGTAKMQLSGSTSTEGGTPPTQIVAVGGRYDETARSLADGEYAMIALTTEGRVIVELQAQMFQVMTNQLITAGASVDSPWIDANGYGVCGFFGRCSAGVNWSYQLHVSPDQSNWAGISSTTNVTASTVATARVDVGHSKYLRVRITNQDASDRTFNVWLQLVF